MIHEESGCSDSTTRMRSKKEQAQEHGLELNMTTGIASREAYKTRTLAIAKGKYVPAKNEPEVWFDSLGTLSQLLSDQNRSLLRLILQKQPKSLHELAKVSGRATSN